MTHISPKNEGKDQNITEQSKIKTTKTIYPFNIQKNEKIYQNIPQNKLK